MAEYVNEDKPIIFKNETDSDFNVGVGIVFRKSGIYEISINDKTTIVTKISERKTGRWVKVNGKTAINCSACYHCSWSWSFEDTVKRFNFCPNCGARMEENEE